MRFQKTNMVYLKHSLEKSKYNFNLNQVKKYKKFKTIIIIGMGGSILGAKQSILFYIKE